MDDIEILPCPFCGGSVRIERRLGYPEHHFYRVKCQSCTVTDGADDPETAAAAWNRRHYPTPTPEADKAARPSADPLLEALQRAASDLPEGYVIRIGVERHAGWVEMQTPDDIDADEPDPHESFACQVHDFINQAIESARAAGERGE